MPFGLLSEDKTGVEWDILLTRDDLGNLLRQFEAVQMASSWFVSFNCDPTQIGELMRVLAENGYVHITPVFWHKEKHTKVSTQQKLTPSVETMVVARKQRAAAIKPTPTWTLTRPGAATSSQVPRSEPTSRTTKVCLSI